MMKILLKSVTACLQSILCKVYLNIRNTAGKCSPRINMHSISGAMCVIAILLFAPAGIAFAQANITSIGCGGNGLCFLSSNSSVIISGTGLGASGSVTFNGVLGSVNSWSPTSITVTTPNNLTAGNVVVTPSSGSPSNVLWYIVNYTIAGISPSSGPVGTTVTVTGTALGANPGTVYFGQWPGPNPSAAVTPSSWRSDQTAFTVVVPSGTSWGNNPICWVWYLGPICTPELFNNTTPAIPVITTPPYIGPVTANESLTLYGENFGASGVVTFGGVQGTITNWSSSEITVTVPPAATSGLMYVTPTGGAQSNGLPFYLSTAVAPINGIGNPGTIPQFSSGTQLINSVITQSGTNIGINTASANFPLTVNGAGAIGDASVNGAAPNSAIPVLNKYIGTSNSGQTYVLLSNFPKSPNNNPATGFDGTIYSYGSQQSKFDVAVMNSGGSGGIGVDIIGHFHAAGSGTTLVSLVYQGQSYIALATPTEGDLYVTGRYWGTMPVLASAASVSNVTQYLLPTMTEMIPPNGSETFFGINTANPEAQLDVNGSVRVSGNITMTPGSGGSVTFSDGTVQSTAYTGIVCGGDFAESVAVSSMRKSYEPGDVLVIDPKNPGKFLKSATPYSPLVAGIYSTKPGYVGRRLTTPKSPDEIPMAMVGIVPTKVSAENGAIHTGDMLVTASTPGYVMKGTDRNRLTGAVVGKALDSLATGKGVIEVLVSLQ